MRHRRWRHNISDADARLPPSDRVCAAPIIGHLCLQGNGRVSLVSEERLQRNFAYEWASGAFVPVMSVLLAVVVGGFVVLGTGQNPFTAYGQLVQGAFGGLYNISETLVSAIPLMLTGLAVAFAFRAGLFNIGAEGQLFMGAILSAWVGY